MKFANKAVLVTGASGGIGRDIAIAFAWNRAHVSVQGADQASVEKLVADIRSEGGIADGFAADVSRREEVALLFHAAARPHGRIDVLVNTAGIACGSSVLEEVTEKEWDQVINRNMKSVFLCSQAGATVMKHRGAGTIINVALHAGRKTRLFAGPHNAAAKAGVIGFTRSMGKELSATGLRVHAVGLSLVYGSAHAGPLWDLYHEDELGNFIDDIPAGRLVSNRDAAAAIVTLATGARGRFEAALDTYGIGWGI